jgi:hypothetical protein
MMGSKAPHHRLSQHLPLTPHPSPRELGKDHGIGFSGDQSCQDRPGRDPPDIGHDRGQFHVGIFEHGLEAIG